MKNQSHKFAGPMLVLFVAAALAAIPEIASASEGTGGGLPWESPLATLRNSITGPVAFGLSIMGVVATGATLIFGADFNAITRSIIYLVLIISLIISATNLLSTLWGRGAELAAAFTHLTLV